MKKTISSTISVVILILVTAQLVIASVSSNSTQSNQDISLTRRDIHPQPRTPLLETITASYNPQLLTVNSSNYIGNIQVEIVGNYELTYTFSVSASSYSEYIDISTLESGSYTVIITTSGSIYTGGLEL